MKRTEVEALLVAVLMAVAVVIEFPIGRPHKPAEESTRVESLSPGDMVALYEDGEFIGVDEYQYSYGRDYTVVRIQ